MKAKLHPILLSMVLLLGTLSGQTETLPTITSQPASQTVTAGQQVIFNVSASGPSPMGFQWRFNGQPLDGSRPLPVPAVPAAPAAATPVASGQHRRPIYGTCCNYILPAATAKNAGEYSVVITSSAGNQLSAVATLKVLGSSTPNAAVVATAPGARTPPQLALAGLELGGHLPFGFQLTGVNGQTIVVEGTTNLLDWTPLLTNSADGNPFYFTDPESAKHPARFYRARLP